MHPLLLGRCGGFFGDQFYFGYVTMAAAQQRVGAFFCWARCQAAALKYQSGGVFLGVRSEDPLPREDRSLSTTPIAGG
jgi:hypothetical protein